jgi:hypothetical protein
MKNMILLCLLSGCFTSKDDAAFTLEQSGFTDIWIGGLAPFSCSDDDMTGRKFKAKNSNAKQISGTVCCGLLKGCTVRF